MRIVRKYLRPCALAWFVLQTASLSALMPADCCAAHEPQALKPKCHDTQGSTPDMTSSASSPGAMHHQATHATDTAHAAHGESAPRSDAERCVIRGTCDGPPLFTLFAHPGVVPAAAVVFPHLDPLPTAFPVSERSVARAHEPDPRPPRI